jgi:hypothetical protein
MFSLESLNIHEATQYGLDYLLHSGVEEDSRNGPVLVAPGPVCTVYNNPRERVLLSSVRDANPFFHLMESLWILSGSNDVAFVAYFAKQMAAYSDDGLTSWGAYGWRARRFFGYDQLEDIIEELRANPASRRCVLQLWNAWPQAGSYDQNYSMNAHNSALQDCDLHVATAGGRDVPCNTAIYFDARGGVVSMTVTNRSNDVIWGAYGANAVHMSFLLEYVAMRVGLPMGVYRQFANNFHLYLDPFPREKVQDIIFDCAALLDGPPLPATGPALEEGFDEDLAHFMTWARNLINSRAGLSIDEPYLTTAFMSSVAVPMFKAWWCRKNKQLELCDRWVSTIAAPDWQRACAEWVERRVQA